MKYQSLVLYFSSLPPLQVIHAMHIYLGLEGIREGFSCLWGVKEVVIGFWFGGYLFKLHNQVSKSNDNPTLIFAITSMMLHSESQSSRGF